jgi:hypothetical protein
MQWVMGLSLTLTLSPRRGNHLVSRREQSPGGGHLPALKELLPLLGERAGVREIVALLLHGYG